jgi:hypothetical protein
MVTAYNEKVIRLFTLARTQIEKLRAQACSQCHEAEYVHWQKTSHAKAYASLVQISREFDPECLRCHTTRFNEPGGFTMHDQQAELRQVQCEACHGEAGGHMENPKLEKPMKPDISTCTKCHTSEQSPGFSKQSREYFEKVKCRPQPN